MMARIPSSPPAIPPLPSPAAQPLWSVMIPVYNCAQYLPETLACVLKQALPEQEMQIEVIDDASTDADVQAIVASIGKGRIGYYRQPENCGSLRNFETCINRSRGQLVHILHGDDRIRDGYYRKLGQLFEQYPEAGAAFTGYSYIDENGKKIYDQMPEADREGALPNWLPRIAERQLIQYVAIVVRRKVYEKLGGFFGITYGEDWEMWVRIAKHYQMVYTPEILAEYRKHVSSISGQKFLTGQNLVDMAYAMELIQEHLAEADREPVLKKSKKFYAYYGVRVANQLWHSIHNKEAVHAQIHQALKMHKDPILYWKILKVYMKMKINRR